jgi:mono/diheme cytochrome c family protein
MRPETLLGGSILRLDTVSLLQQGNLPLNVATGIPEEDGITLLDEYNFGFGDPELANLYDPQAPNAPLTIYATGLRNQYDLVWHSNGHLYVPVNGSANGGNVPGTPSQLPFSCQYRVDSLLYGPYTGPMVSPQTDLVVQPDLLVDIVEGGYYGHPNPTRCEWIAYGGNPTSQADRGQVGDHYPIGTLPDRNWRGYIFDFGTHQSPNGIITYQSNVFEGQLQGKLLVTRYSAGNDILVLELGGENGDVIGFHESIPGLAHLNSPLDLTEDVRNGNLYVSEFGARTISLLRPINDLTPAQITHLRRQTATLKLNTAFVIGFSLVLFAGTMSLGTGFILIRHYLQREKPAGHWNGFLSTTIIAGVIVIGLLSVAFYPLRKGWREFRQQLVTIQSVQLHPEEQVSTQLAPIEGTPIVRSYDPAEIEIGREIFRLNCASCHGDSGAGDTGIGVRLVNNSYILYHEDDELVEFLTTGRLPWDTDNRTGMTMPAKGGNPNLTEEDLRYLVAYLRTLNQQE